jgi:hypothetical protein
MNRRAFLLAAIAAAALPPLGAAGPALADDVDWGKIVLTEIQRRLIGNYYQRRYGAWVAAGPGKGKNKLKGLPPGIAKKGVLPPGIYMQLMRGQRLPVGIGAMPLPYDLVMQLPPPYPGTRLLIADDKVLLVQIATNLILDVLTVAAIEATRD